MSRIRQYVGARYVPKYDGEWDTNKTYEPLTIVTVANVGSYTSKKFVPAGVSISNTEYWALSGTTTGQIVDLNNRVDALEDDVEGLQGETSSLDGRMDDAESDISTLENSVSQLTTDMSEAQSDISTLETSLGKVIDRLARRFILISDSYANRVNGSNNNFFQIFKNALDLDDTELYTANIAGAAFAHSSTNYRFITLLQNLESTVTNKDSITDIIVIGGANDAGYSETNTKNAIAAFNTYAKGIYPNAKITLMPCGLTFTSASMLNQKKVYNTWCKAQYLGINYIANSEYIMRNTAMLDPTDKCHPSTSGVDAIANALINWVQGQTVEASYSDYIPGDGITAETMSGLTQFTVSSPTLMNRRHNGSVTINGRNGGEAFTVVSDVSMNFPSTGGGGIRVKLPNGCMAGGCDTDNPTYAGIGVDPATGKVYPFACLIRAYASYTELDCYFQTGVPVSDGVHRMAMYLTISLTD